MSSSFSLEDVAIQAGCGKGIRWGLGFWGCDSYHQSESLSSHIMAFFLKDSK